MTTLISHFYNEEYLLPYWLDHHKRIFDSGVLINYGSTDNSIQIIKDICPNWFIVDSRNQEFHSYSIDNEVMQIESQIKGWKMTLNTTEFLITDGLSDILNKYQETTMLETHGIAAVGVFESPSILNVNYGHFNAHQRRRKIHNHSDGAYVVGRHESNHHSIRENFYTVWYEMFPYNSQTINRKLQIQNKIPVSDKNLGLGVQHLTSAEKLGGIYSDRMRDKQDLFSDENFKSVFNGMIDRYYKK